MDQIVGVSVQGIPFISTILAPQLKLRRLPLYFVQSLAEVTGVQATFSLLDGDSILREKVAIQQELQAYLSLQQTSVAFTQERNYKNKISLLELGFKHCIDLPTATEVIIKTIENSIRTKSNIHTLSEPATNYQCNTSLSYIHDRQGRYFLVNKKRSTYLNPHEQSILEYLLKRQGFASRNELSYAGWKHFATKANTITVVVKKLRKKLRFVHLPYVIRSMYGYGYRIDDLMSRPCSYESSG